MSSSQSRIAATLQKFRQEQAAATRTVGALAKEREAKKAQRKAAPPPKPRAPPAAGAGTSAAERPGGQAAKRSVPIGKLKKDVVDCIMAEDGRAMTADDIKTKCGIDIRADGELLAALQNSEKLELVNGFWTYKATHKAANKAELAKLMLKYPEGLKVLEVKDSYKGVADDLTALKQEGRIYVIQNLDNPDQDVIFPCDEKLRLSVDEDVVQLWAECNVSPDDMEEKLKTAGAPWAASFRPPLPPFSPTL